MKKRVLSALLALCLTFSLAGAAFAENETPVSSSSSAASESVAATEPESKAAATSDSTSGESKAAATSDSTSAESKAAATSDSTSAESKAESEPEEEPTSDETPAASDVTEEEPEETAESEATPAPTEDPEAEVTEKTETDGSVEYTAALETDGQTMNVVVTAPADAFGADVQPTLHVAAIEDETEAKAIEDKLAENNIEYDGFAALDISFTDADGNEIEPSEPVTVRIELPDSIIDSGIDLNTLAVQHFAENEAGNVTSVDQVASVADNTIVLSDEAKAAMEAQAAEENAANGVAPMMMAPAANNALTADNGEAEETEAPIVAEFEVNGFSTFTITWNISWASEKSAYVSVVDTNGTAIGNNSNYSISRVWSWGDWVPDTSSKSVESLANRINGVSGYNFQYAAIDSYDGTKITALKLMQSGHSYKVQYQDNTGWNDLNDRQVYFVFEEIDNRKTIDTLDTDSLGITINLFDYEKDAVKNNGAYLGEFDFGSTEDRNNNQWWNHWNTNIGATQDIMKPLLDENGYPQFNDNINPPEYGGTVPENKKAAWLFTQSDIDGARKAYTKLNHLFIDQDGYYYYNSAKNFASITAEDPDKNNGSYESGNHDFVVYNDPTTNQAQFMPFNTVNGNYSLNGNADYLFGMEVAFNFVQPQSGKVATGQGNTATQNDMVFEFSGDDDVWVYIDNVLVLDIGGIHGAITGTINFADGTVTVDNVKGEGHQVKDLKDCFIEALGEDAAKQIGWVETRVNGQTYHTFADFSDHDFKFFYLERGEGGSNCMMKFNIPTIPTDSIAVSKKVSGDAPENVTSYTMQLVIDNLEEIRQNEGLENFGYGDITWNVANSDDEQALLKDNTFTVAAGQTVLLNNIPATAEYHINELNVAGTATVTINGDNKTPVDGSKTATSATYTMTENKSVSIINAFPIAPPEDFGITTDKTAVRQENDPTQYELSLSMTGDRDRNDPAPTPVDILFIVDKSGSMTPTRMNAVRNAIDALVDDIEVQKNGGLIDPRYNVVAFSNKGSTSSITASYHSEYGWTSQGSSVKNAVDQIRAGGGTNWEAAIKEGNKQLDYIIQRNEQSNRDAEQIVIFLSDGMPTYYGNDQGDGNQNRMDYDEIEECKNAAIDDVQQMNCDRFYAVGIGSDFDSESDHGYTCLDDLRNAASNATATDIFSAQDPNDLVNKFKDIAESLTFFSCVDVEMVDQLSPNANLVQDKGNVTFTVQLERWDETARQYVVIGQPQNDVQVGNSATFSASQWPYSQYIDETVVITPTVESPDNQQPIIKVTLTGEKGAEYETEPGIRYTVKTMITPSQTAINAFNESGEEAYTDQPDFNTGTHAGTSTRENGFFSNNNDNAKVNYNVKTETDGSVIETPYSEPFPKPVIQVQPQAGDLTITKDVAWSNPTQTTDVDQVEFKFTITTENENVMSQPEGGYTMLVNGQPTDVKAIFSELPDTNPQQYQATVEITGEGSVVVQDLPLGTYIVKETDAPDVDVANTDNDYYCVSKRYGNDPEATQASVNLTQETTDQSVSVTNTYEQYRTVTVIKDVTGEMGDTTKFFSFTAQTGTDTKTDVPQANIHATETTPVTANVTGNGAFELKDDGTRLGSVTIVKVRQDDTLTVTETPVANEGYTTTNTINGTTSEGSGNIATITPDVLADRNVIVEFENNRPVVAPTGLEDNHTKPFGLMIGFAVLAGMALAGGIVVRRRRRWME